MEDFGGAMEIIRRLIIRKTMEALMREVFLRFRKFKKACRKSAVLANGLRGAEL